MKKLALVAVVVAVVAMMAFGVYAASDIRNTKHNLSMQSKNHTYSTNYNEICVFCHTPHAAGSWPLWNRDMTSISSFKMYTTSPTFKVTATDIDSTSKLCFSCHLTASSVTNSLNNPSNLVNSTQPTFNHNISSTAVIGSDLRDDHPVAFSYNTAQGNNSYELETATTAAAKLGDPTTAVFPNGDMTCATCHDVHGKVDVNNGNKVIPVLLRRSNASSMLCLSCHKK